MPTVNSWYKRDGNERTLEGRQASWGEAVRTLDACQPLGRVAQKYLESRRIWFPEYLSDVLWNQSPWHGLVARIRKRPCGPVIGIQITALTSDGAKVARRNFGELEGGAIWLGEGDPPMLAKPGAIIGEGLETVLSAMTIYGKTQGLACMSWHNVIKAPILPHWQAIVIASDRDEYGHKAAEGLRKRLDRMKTARKVITCEPDHGNDFNDMLRASPSK